MTLAIYGAGGTGVNIAKQLTDLCAQVYFVDTSVSNLKDVRSDNIFLVEGMDGAGKDRRVTSENFKDISTDVLVKLKPSEQLNVVISSLSGGSGSVIAPHLAKALVQAGHNTIVIGVHSAQSTRELTNCLNTLLSYRGMFAKIGESVAMYYVNNPKRDQADRETINFVRMLALLVDRARTEEFDTSDLKNFLRFELVTDNAPGMAILEVSLNEAVQVQKGTAVIGTILLTKEKNTKIEPVIPEYLSTCVVTDTEAFKEDMRLNTVLGKVAVIVDGIQAELKEQHDFKKVNKVRDLEVSGGDDDGAVL